MERDPEHNPGEPEFGDHEDDAPHNPGELDFNEDDPAGDSAQQEDGEETEPEP